MIKVVLKNAHQTISDDISYIICVRVANVGLNFIFLFSIFFSFLFLFYLGLGWSIISHVK